MNEQKEPIRNGCVQRFKAAEASRIRLWCIVLVLLTIIGSTGVVLSISTLDMRDRIARVEERVIAMQKTLEMAAHP